jgi:hypothetical protein
LAEKKWKEIDMAKDFEKDLNDLIKGHQDNEEPGARSVMVNQLRAAAEQVSKGEPWPGEVKASEAAQKAGLAPAAEPAKPTTDNKSADNTKRK